MQKSPIFWMCVALIGFCIGVYIQVTSYFSRPLTILFICSAFSQLLYVGVVSYFFRRKGVPFSTSLFRTSYIIIVFSLSLITGVFRVELMNDKLKLLCDTSCTFRAEVDRTPTKDGVNQFVLLKPEGDARVMLVKATVPLYPEYSIGDTLDVSGKVELPKLLLPHTSKRSFDYVSYLEVHNVGSVMYFPKLQVVDSNPHTIISYLGRFKERCVATLHKYIGGTEASLASGMLFGATDFNKETVSSFRFAGLSHIVVLSGFNIAIVISSLLALLAFLPIFVRVLVASLGVFMFVLMVGAEASVLRATIMSSIALCATLVGRGYVAKQALLISAFIITLYNPESLIYDASLHLSFLATVGIVWGESLARIMFSRIRSAGLLEVLSTSLSAYLVTLPYLLATFGGVSLYALAANVIVVPVVGVCMLLAFLVVVTSFVWQPLAILIAFFTKWMLSYVVWVATFVGHLPLAYIQFSIRCASMWAMYLLLVAILAWCSKVCLSKVSAESAESAENIDSEEELHILRGVVSY